MPHATPTPTRKNPLTGNSLRSYLVAFVVMVVAFVVVDLVVIQSLRDSNDDGLILGLVGGQRARAETLAKDAEVLVGPASEAQKRAASQEFNRVLGSLEGIHEAAIRGNAESRLHTRAQQLSLWIPTQNAFGELVHTATEFRAAFALQPNAADTRRLAYEIGSRSTAFGKPMGDFMAVLAQQRFEAIDATERSALFMLVMFVMTLVAQGFYVFWPAMRRVRASLEQVTQLQNQVEVQNGLLSERNKNLEEQRQILETQRLELEAQNGELQASQVRLEEQRAVLAQQHSDTQRQKESLEQLATSLEAAKDLQAQAARRAEELFQGVPVACFSFDADGVLHAWNRAAEELYGFAAYEVLWRPMWEALDHSHAEPHARASIARVFQQNESSVSEWTFTRRDGKRLVLQTTSFPIRDALGRVIAGIGTTLDLTERRQYEQAIEENLLRINDYSLELESQKWELQEANNRLSDLASTDGLTGLTNHRTFQERLEIEFDASIQDGSALSLVLADVDNFKLFNDQYGHPAGDRVLQQVAQTLRNVTGGKGIACRYGGEEFVIILPGMGEDDAIAMAELMRRYIDESGPEGLRVTASFGVASWTANTRSRAELIAQSDKALYMSKKAGRNCVTHARVLDGFGFRQAG